MPPRLHAPSLAVAVALCLAEAHAQPVVAGASEQAAEAYFDRGVALAGERRWAAAATEFERAYALAPLPTTLFNLAEARAEAGQVRAALRAYREYQQIAGATAAPRYAARVAAQTDALAQRLCHLSIDVTPASAVVRVDDETLTPDAREVELDPGSHAIVVRADGYEPDARTMTFVEGARATLALRLSRVASEVRVVREVGQAPPVVVASPPAVETPLAPRNAFQLSAAYQGLIAEDGWGSGIGVRVGMRLSGSFETFGTVGINKADGVIYTVGGVGAAYVFHASRRVPVLVGATLGVLIPDCSAGCALASDPTRSAETDLTALGMVGMRLHLLSWLALAVDASVGAARLTADFPYPLIYFSLGPHISVGM